MSKDYKELLDQNVDDVKEAINDLEDADYQELLDLEEEGDDRKTVKEFLEKKIEKLEEAEEQVVENIEQETEGGFLGSFDREKVLVGGVLAGLVIGLVAGFAFNMADSGSQAEVRNSLNQLFEATGTQPDSITVTDRNGMFYATINSTVETENGTRSGSQSYFISPDGELLFPATNAFGQQSYRNIDDLITQAQQQQQQPSGNTSQ
ncbi:MAG: hypothetical protein ACI8Z7_000236 [Candidatus Nanohaloarchaea archaeon]|jgi:hypothetical protein